MNVTLAAALVPVGRGPATSSNMSEAASTTITPFVSYHVFSIFMYAIGVTATNAVALFGVFGNMANILVYSKMGLKETTNISFFCLALNDLVVSIGTIIVEICESPPMKIVDLPPGALVLQIDFGTSFFVYSSCGFGAWVTAILSTERCLCISFPMKVSTDLHCLILTRATLPFL